MARQHLEGDALQRAANQPLTQVDNADGTMTGSRTMVYGPMWRTVTAARTRDGGAKFLLARINRRARILIFGP